MRTPERPTSADAQGPIVEGWDEEEKLADDVARPGVRADGLPFGKRSSRVAVAQRLSLVEGLVAEGRPRYEIVGIMLDKFNMPARTADRYLALAWEALEEAARAADPMKLIGARVARLTRLSRAAERQGDMRSVAKFEALLIDVTGTRAPTNVNVRGAVAHAHVAAPPVVPLPDLSGLSDEELDTLERAAGIVKARTPALPAPVLDAEVVSG